jgi:hypothetical protein
MAWRLHRGRHGEREKEEAALGASEPEGREAREAVEPLTAAQKSKAKASAKRTGRRYPNLVDNMNAAKKKGAKGKS